MASMTSWLAERARAELCRGPQHPSPGTPRHRVQPGAGGEGGVGAPCLTPAPSLPQSRLVRDQVPYFIWTNRHGAIDCRLLRQDQVVNHYARVGAFTTKVGAWSPWGGGETAQQG